MCQGGKPDTHSSDICINVCMWLCLWNGCVVDGMCATAVD